MNWSKSDTAHMRRALALAKRGAGYTSPNPMVGAVIVKNDEVVGEGYHRRFGSPHAEVEAIRLSHQDLAGATMYVNLEPCSHFGKTPPCTDEIVKAGIGRVVVSALDPNPTVTGRGTDVLRENGVEVEIGLLASEANILNEAYLKHTREAIPFVIMKAAVTLDGRIADREGSSKWISCERSRKLVHRLRREVDSVLVGIGTVLKDDPQLTVRLVLPRRNPTRIILDSDFRVPPDAKVVDGEAPTIIVTGQGRHRAPDLAGRNSQVWQIKESSPGRINLLQFLKKAGAQGLSSILVEGGSRIYSSFLREKLVDKFYFFIAPRLLGDGVPLMEEVNSQGLADSLRLTKITYRKIDSDLLLTAYPE